MWLTDSVKEFFRKADVLLLVLIVAASLFGVVLIYSATRWMGAAGARFVPIQLVAIVLGVAVYFVMSFVDVELFTERSWKWMLFFNVCIILMLLTLRRGQRADREQQLAGVSLPSHEYPAG